MILAVFFALMTPLLYGALYLLMDLSREELTMEGMGMGYMLGKNQFFAGFSMTNNLGLLAPVLIAVILCKDFSHGTIRNKIIAGKSRTAIFLSMYITCATALVTVILLSNFITLGVGSVMFGYQGSKFTLADFGYFMASLGMDILVLLFEAALLCLFCVLFRKAGFAIILYIASVLVLTMVGGIVQFAVLLAGYATVYLGVEEYIFTILEVLNKVNVAMATQNIGTGVTYAWEDVLYLVGSSTLGIIAFLTLGGWIFKNKDLK